MSLRGPLRLAGAAAGAALLVLVADWSVRADPQVVAAAVNVAHAAHLSPYGARAFRREVATPYPAVNVPDARLPIGMHEVLRPGQGGLVLQTGVAFYRPTDGPQSPAVPRAGAAGTGAGGAPGGAPVSATPVAIKVFSQTVLRVARPATVAAGSGNDLVQAGGHFYHYSRVLTMVATAYDSTAASNGPYTGQPAAIGLPLQYGIVAVDPRVIPLGTRLYVQGYGLAVAGDTGSAIVGDRIDLFFWNTPRGIAAFGLRHLKVYVLDDPRLPPVPVPAAIRREYPAAGAPAGSPGESVTPVGRSLRPASG